MGEVMDALFILAGGIVSISLIFIGWRIFRSPGQSWEEAARARRVAKEYNRTQFLTNEARNLIRSGVLRMFPVRSRGRLRFRLKVREMPFF